MRRAILGSVFGLAACLVWVSSASAANTYYTLPTGGSTSCAPGNECSLAHAVSLATNPGDAIVVEPGNATYASGTQTISHPIDIGGQAGAAIPKINGNFVISDGGATIHDLSVDASGVGFALNVQAGVADRITAVGGTISACSLISATLRDTVCFDTGGQGILDSAASVGTHSSEIRNVTAIAPNNAGIELISGASGNVNTIHAVNLIARGGFADLQADQGSAGVATISAVNSNYAVVKTFNGATVTPAGANGGQTAAPLFVDEAAGDFRELAASPTVDAGQAAADLGPLDLGRTPRSQPVCLGGAPKPDIGAFELAPPAPPLAPCSVFTIGPLTLNKKKGTGVLTIVVPGSGVLQATGKGLKTASASPSGAGDAVLTLRTTGKSKRSLARKGKVRLQTTISWTPTGGSSSTQPDKLKLKKRIKR